MKKLVLTVFGKNPVTRIIIYLLIILFFRAFIVSSMRVNDSKMEASIHKGDRILVNKIKFGARLPVTLLSVPFTQKLWIELIQLPYIKLPGLRKVRRNDLIVFNYPNETDAPLDKKSRLVKRCIAIPGDTLQIDNKEVFINSDLLDSGNKLEYLYRVVSDGTTLDYDILKKYQISDIKVVADIGIFDIIMSANTAEEILSKPFVRTVRELKLLYGSTSRDYFPGSGFFNWNRDFFGPLVIPKKGVTAIVNHRNIYLYKRIIEVFEGNEVITKLEDVFINGEKINEYTFKKNYYFVLDDNRDDSNDSRHWGFVPEDHIIGTTGFILFSAGKKNNSKGIKVNRFFKKVR